MGEEHHNHSSDRALDVRVLVVTSSRDAETDTGGALCVERLQSDGHGAQRDFCPDDMGSIQEMLVAYVNEGADAVILTGGTGVSRNDVTPEACEAMFDRHIPGFGELFRLMSFQEIGSAAMLSRATAGLIGPMVVFAIPGSEDAVATAMDVLILPELPHLAGEVAKEGAPGVAMPRQYTEEIEPEFEDEGGDFEEEEDDESADLPTPTGSLGRLGQGTVKLSTSGAAETPAPDDEDGGDLPSFGWKRAAFEIEGDVNVGDWTDLPEVIEKISPVVDVLHQAGERGTMKVPSGRTYILFGYPDLQRPTSKVLAIADGDPLCEVIALHRYPIQTGMLIDTSEGLLPHSTRYSVEGMCDAITGSSPKDTSGEVFAIQGDTVWIVRDNRVIRWDGTKEFDDGTTKQVMATLVLHWSNR